MDSIRSCDILKKDIESFYKLIVENKHDRTITPSKRKKKIHPQHKYFSWGEKPIQNSYIYIV